MLRRPALILQLAIPIVGHMFPHSARTSLSFRLVPVKGVRPCQPSAPILRSKATGRIKAFYHVHTAGKRARLQGRYTPRVYLPHHTRQAHDLMGTRILPVWLVRGGTSNGLVIRRQDLPSDPTQWRDILSAIMGSPDSYGRQLNGLGSGTSSTSKVVVLGPPSRPDVDVDFTFVQVGIKDGVLDMAGNCGNMSSIVGPAAWDQGMVKTRTTDTDTQGRTWATVRFLNTNTSKVMTARFKVSGEPLKYCSSGDFSMDGVSATNSKITLSFLNPAGAKTGKALPTGNPLDMLQLPDGSQISASLVDVGNPGVFISGKSLGLDETASWTPEMVEADPDLKSRLEDIRRAGASLMGMDPDTESVPKVVMLRPSTDPDLHLRCLAMSMGQAHKAVPLTLSLCLGAACQLKGTIANNMLTSDRDVTSSISIGHPGGKVDVQIVTENGKITSAQLLRTARVMMKGDAYY